METDQDSYSFSIDPSENTEQGRMSRSSINQYCRQPQNEEPTHDSQKRKLYYCNHCSWSGIGTTNVRTHLRNKHQIICPAIQLNYTITSQKTLIDLYKQLKERQEI